MCIYRKLIRRGKILKEGGGGNDRNAQYISLFDIPAKYSGGCRKSFWLIKKEKYIQYIFKMSLITDKGDDLPILRAEHHGGAGGGGGRGLGGGQSRGGHCRDIYLPSLIS